MKKLLLVLSIIGISLFGQKVEPPLSGGGGGGGGTPAAPSGSIQFNNAGAFGGSADFTRDLVTGNIQVGGAPNHPEWFINPGVYIGPNESTLPAAMQNAGASSLYITAVDNSGNNAGALTVEAQGSGLSAIWAGFIGQGDGSLPTAINAYVIGQDTDSPVAVEAQIDARGALTGTLPTMRGFWVSQATVRNGFTATDLVFFDADGINLSGTGAVTNAYGLRLPDITQATNNYAFKSGAGMVEVGDATKAAGIHVQGAGAFDVDGSGLQSPLWIDIDNDTPLALFITNETAGATHSGGMNVLNSGNLTIFADIDGPNGGNLTYDIAANQWQVQNSNSLQVSSWISTLRNTAPADGDITANELADWYNPANGAAFAMFKSKTADGTVVAAGFGMNTVAAPSPSTIVLPTSVYGGSAQLLGGPTAWKSEIINGTTYKIPLY